MRNTDLDSPLITREEKNIIKRYYSFVRAHCVPGRISMKELGEKIVLYRNRPHFYCITNMKTKEIITLRGVIYSMSSRRVDGSLTLLSDGTLAVQRENSWYFSSDSEGYIDETNKKFYISKILSELGDDVLVSDMTFQLIKQANNDKKDKTLLDLVSSVIASSTTNKSPVLSDAEVFTLLLSGTHPRFFDENLFGNGVEFCAEVNGNISYSGNYARRGTESILDDLIYKSVHYHIQTNFTSDDIRRLEYEELLSDYRFRLPVKEMVMNFIRCPESERQT